MFITIVAVVVVVLSRSSKYTHLKEVQLNMIDIGACLVTSIFLLSLVNSIACGTLKWGG